MNCPYCGYENIFTVSYCIRCGEEFKKETSSVILNANSSLHGISEKNAALASPPDWKCIKALFNVDPQKIYSTEVLSLSLNYRDEIISIVRKHGTLEIIRTDGKEIDTLHDPFNISSVRRIKKSYNVLDAVFPSSIKNMTAAEKSRTADSLFLPDNSLVSLDSDGMIRIRDLYNNGVAHEIPAAISLSSRLIISPDNSRIAISNAEQNNKKIAITAPNIEIFGITAGVPKRVLCKDFTHNFPSSVRFFPDGQRLLSANSTKIGVWNTSLGQIVRSLTKNEDPITCLCFSDKGTLFVSGDEKGGLVVWDAVSLTFYNSLKDKAPGRINDICFVPGTDYFFTALENKSIILWKADKGNFICSLEGHKGPVTALCISRDGKTLISGDRLGEIRIWKSFERKEACSL